MRKSFTEISDIAEEELKEYGGAINETARWLEYEEYIYEEERKQVDHWEDISGTSSAAEYSRKNAQPQ